MTSMDDMELIGQCSLQETENVHEAWRAQDSLLSFVGAHQPKSIVVYSIRYVLLLGPPRCGRERSEKTLALHFKENTPRSTVGRSATPAAGKVDSRVGARGAGDWVGIS